MKTDQSFPKQFLVCQMNKKSKCPICGSANCVKFLETFAQMHNDRREKFCFNRCVECSYVFLNPNVPPDELKRFYPANYLPYRGASAWGKYAALVRKSEEKLNEKRAAMLLRYGSPAKKSKILDIGCGKPDFLLKCYEKFGSCVFGLDFNDAGWKNEAEKYAEINLTVGGINDLPDDEKFDFITMWHYLEHDYTPFETLRSLREKSHRETVLIIEVPDFESDSRRRFGEFWAGYHTPRHISVFSEKNLSLLLTRTGWKVIETNRFGTLDPYILYWLSHMEQKGIDWEKSMKSEFANFVFGMICFLPKKILSGGKALGVMTAVACPA
jgi:SAM-dependent methyltransferase